MGISYSVITVKAPENKFTDEIILNALGYNDNKPLGEVCFNPRSIQDKDIIDIGYFNGCIVLLDHFKFIHEYYGEHFLKLDRMHPVECGLSSLYPDSEIITAHCVNASNAHYYSIVKDRQRIRMKTIADSTERVEYGEPIEEEQEIYAGVKMENGKPVYADGQLVFNKYEDMEFVESQLMEDFTFGVLYRHLGIRLDSSGVDEIEKIKFRSYKVGTKQRANEMETTKEELKEIKGYEQLMKDKAAEALISLRKVYAYYYFDMSMKVQDIEAKFREQGIEQQYIDNSRESVIALEKHHQGGIEYQASENKTYAILCGFVFVLGLVLFFYDFKTLGCFVSIISALLLWYFAVKYADQKNTSVEINQDYSRSEEELENTLKEYPRVRSLFMGENMWGTTKVHEYMPEDEFWKLVEKARNSAHDTESQSKALVELLKTMDKFEVAKFGNQWNKLSYSIYTYPHYIAYCIAHNAWVEIYTEKIDVYMLQGESFYKKLIEQASLFFEQPDLVYKFNFHEIGSPAHHALGHTLMREVSTGADHYDDAADELCDFIYDAALDERIEKLKEYYPDFAAKHPKNNLFLEEEE